MEKCFALSLLASTIFIVSCNPSGSEANPEPQPQNCTPANAVATQITGKHWITTAESTTTVSGTDTTTENTFANTANCSLDDFLEFKASNVVTSDNGSNKCVPFTPQSINGYWCTTNNGQRITMTLGGLSGEAEILSLTPKEMIWRETKNNQPQGKSTIIQTTFRAL